MREDRDMTRRYTITTCQLLREALVDYAKRNSPTVMHLPAVVRVVEHGTARLLQADPDDEGGDWVSIIRELLNATSREAADKVDLQPCSQALLDYVVASYATDPSGDMGLLADLLGFRADGLAFEQTGNSYALISLRAFEEQTGCQVRIPICGLPLGFPVLAQGVRERALEQ